MAIQKMNYRHRQIARRLLIGESQRDVAKSFGISEFHLSRLVHSEIFSKYMNELEREVEHGTIDTLEHLQAHAKDAVDALIAIIQNPESSHHAKRKAATDILRLGNYDRPQQPPVRSFGTITWEQRLRNTFGDFDRVDDVDAEDQTE